jgi:transcriptional regulator with XRE-family HTH domain
MGNVYGLQTVEEARWNREGATVRRSSEPGSPLGEAVRERREELEMTQHDLAAAADTSQKRIWQIERTSTRVSYEALVSLAQALEVPLEFLTLRARVIEADRQRAAASSD